MYSSSVGTVIGCSNSKSAYLANAGALDTGLKIRVMTLPDVFQDHDTPFAMYDAARLNAQHIAACAIDALGRGDLSALERVVRA